MKKKIWILLFQTLFLTISIEKEKLVGKDLNIEENEIYEELRIEYGEEIFNLKILSYSEICTSYEKNRKDK